MRNMRFTWMEKALEDVELGKMKTNLGGKLNVSIELDEGKKASVKVIKC